MAWVAEERVVYNPKLIAKKFEQISSDFIETPSHKLVMKWYRSVYTDLYIWVDQESGGIVRQQFSYLGMIVEWNQIQGVKTGLVVDTPQEETGQKVNTVSNIQYDNRPLQESINSAIEIMKLTHSIDEKEEILSNMYNGPKMSKWQLFKLMVRFFKRRKK